eukprot:TRINITY_DN220_c0_g1_i11.p1 TRINITY_DN220_c0_g1~~TRINITY_DN220_c0_g1_i11.p1  ORF type:complete len:797 (+),score=161.30 TRINITY_DN220_c0_g1_i11:164-2554(+)
MRFSSKFLAGALLAVQTVRVLGDVYMQFPPGSNDRNRERNENRNNGNRLFDTQNNAKGGYPWCGDRELNSTWDGFKFYTGSVITFEWTAQHGVGPDNNVDAQIILQYSCNGLSTKGTSLSAFAAADPDYPYFLNIGPPNGIARDGYPTGPLTNSDTDRPGQYYQASFVSTGQNTDGTNRIPCPTLGGCNGNFGDTSLDNDLYAAYKWYDNPNTTSATGYIAMEFGYHETYQYYLKRCLLTQRNRGLYTADQQINGNDARFTRQNPNGGRDGLECSEERDYYPWWGVSPWRDIAVLVSHADNWENQCNYYKQESQNVKGRSYCKKANISTLLTNGVDLPLDQTKCLEGNPNSAGTVSYTTGDVTWVKMPSFGLDPPVCMLHALSRDNHLGNAVSVTQNGHKYNIGADVPNPSTYSWKIPEGLEGLTCVVRIRYNLSAADYPQSNWNNPTFSEAKGETAREKIMWDMRYNCPTNTENDAKANVYNPNLPSYCQNMINETTGYVPVFERPYLNVSTVAGYPLLAMAFQTDQVARTFQDRSYVLKFASFGVAGATIHNLNNRGRRGNIVQCYPAVENSFYPTSLTMGNREFLHIQFCGSDFNPNNNPNDGEGWRYSTRYNIIALSKRMLNVPKMLKAGSYAFGAASADQINLMTMLAFANQTNTVTFSNGTSVSCMNFQGDNSDNANNHILNCAKLNPSKAHIDYGVSTNLPVGSYVYVSTRNNNFSNRSNKGLLNVFEQKDGGLTVGQKAGIAVGSILFVGVVGCAGAVFYAKKNPSSRIAQLLSRKGKSTGTATTTNL